MNKNILLQNGIIFFYILQRLSEVMISADNEKWLKKHCQAVEVDPQESLRMKLFHTMWFLGLLVEANMKREFSSQQASILIYFILGLCLMVRFHTIEKLKRFWTIKVFSMKNQIIVSDGIYRFIRHPNYLVVVIEFIFIPLLFKAYVTMFLFSLLNIFILFKRIKLEERTLMKQTNYRDLFFTRKRFFPFILIFLMTAFSAAAAELKYHFNNYDEAKNATSFVKFESTSTKFGFITTGFDGYAKNVKINYKLENTEVSNMVVMVDSKELDTDLSGRNEKMFKEVLEVEKYPQIQIDLPEKINLMEGEHTTEMIFTIKDKNIKKMVKFKVLKDGEKFIISGSTSLGLKEAGLPDPSIVIAKVRDLFDLKFRVTLP